MSNEDGSGRHWVDLDLDPSFDPFLVEKYRFLIEYHLQKIMPEFDFSSFGTDPDQDEDARQALLERIPLLTHSSYNESTGNLSFYLLIKSRQNAFRFFFDLVSNWMTPGKRLHVVLFFAADFRLTKINDDLFTFAEMIIRVKDVSQWEQIQNNFTNIQTETRLGALSEYYAKRILEVKGLTTDAKTAMVQERIISLVERLPEEFDYDVYAEMQHLLVTCRDSFKEDRSTRHLSRIITVQYLFRKSLSEEVRFAPKQRHLHLKLFKARVQEKDEERHVLCIIVGVNFFGQNEVLEDRHLLKAIRNYLPDIREVEGSFFTQRRVSNKICTLYLEIEKEDQSVFSGEEIQRLRRDLAADLKDRIEYLMHPVFMPRNEEEVMRNIVVLSSQIKYLRDPSQVFITFDEQTEKKLFFTVIHVRVVRPGDLPIQQLFSESDSFLDYLHDSAKTIGFVRKKYPKEATVFRLAIKKERFLRGDHSIDLYKARQVVLKELERVVGKVRDFNGGMISKQHELLCSVRNLLAESANFNDVLLENFFYSLNPPIMRSVLDPNDLAKLFLLMQDTVERYHRKRDPYSIAIERDLNVALVMIVGNNPRMREKISQNLTHLKIPPQSLATVNFHTGGTVCLGYLYRSDDPYNQDVFCQTVRDACDRLLSVPVSSQTV